MKNFITITALLLLFASCKKEISNESGGGGTRLTKITATGGTDSVGMEFTYNTSGRLTEYKMGGTVSGTALNESITYTRNSSEIITKEIYKSSSLPFGLSQVVTDHFYDNSAKRYSYSVTKLDLGLIFIRDSVGYNYDGSGRVSEIIDYLDAGSGTYSPSMKQSFTYTGANVTKVVYATYDVPTTSWTDDETDTYEFDSKVNPLQFTGEAMILRTIFDYPTFYSANNYTKQTLDITPTATTRTFTYNGSSRPETAAVSDGSSTITFKYYYQ